MLQFRQNWIDEVVTEVIIWKYLQHRKVQTGVNDSAV